MYIEFKGEKEPLDFPSLNYNSSTISGSNEFHNYQIINSHNSTYTQQCPW